MTEPLSPRERFENFMAPFRDEFNAEADSQAEDKTKFHRDCINATIVKVVAVNTNLFLKMAFNDTMYFLDAVRLLHEVAISHPDILDDARDELISIIKELSPNTNMSLLEG